MKHSDRLQDLSLKLGLKTNLYSSPINTPSQANQLEAISVEDFIRALLDLGVGYPVAHTFMKDSLYLCFILDINTKFEIQVRSLDPEGLWKIIKKRMVDEFTYRFARVQ